MIFTTSAYRGEKVYRLRAGEALDSYNDPIESWDTPDRLLLRGADVQAPGSTEAESPTGTTTTAERVLFVPGAPDVRENDRIEVGSQVWRVDGIPAVRRGLAMSVYTTANLRRVSTTD